MENTSDIKPLVERARKILHTVYGNRLKGVVLYGSAARGDMSLGSDIDLLVLLTPPVSLGRELRTIIKALYPLQLETDCPIHAMPIDENAYQAGESSWYRNAKEEGILV